jgi:hypothetical protein
MKHFIDSEFIEDGKTIDLISIGLVDETGDELYLISSEFDESKASDWVRENVLSKLASRLDVQRYPKKQIAEMVRGFLLMNDTPPEIWGYYADYDWVLLAQLFGRMIDLPKGMPFWCRDLKQLATDLHVELPQPAAHEEHHALADARWIAAGYELCQAAKGPFVVTCNRTSNDQILAAFNSKHEVREFLKSDPRATFTDPGRCFTFKGEAVWVRRMQGATASDFLTWEQLQ